MANRRMFSSDVVKSDEFYDLPISSQALYFHLGMDADDRGYVNNPRSIIKIIGASSGDLEILINKGFILLRENSLILITHWRMNNYLQKDRFKETKFISDLKKLFFDENNCYTNFPTNYPCLKEKKNSDDEENTSPELPCIQNVSNMYTQDSIGKDSIGKDSIDKNSKDIKEDNNEEENKEEIFSIHYFIEVVKEEYLSNLTSQDEASLKEMFTTLCRVYKNNNIYISLNHTLSEMKQKVINNPIVYLKNAMFINCEQFKNKGGF